MTARRAGFHNAEPTGVLPEGAPKDAAKAEFARRLQAAMVEKGWNQSELANRASKEAGKDIGRYSISCYMRGLTLPRPEALSPIAKVLGKKPGDLLPTRGVPSVEERAPSLDVKDVGDGRAWLRVNQAVSWETALKIMQLLKTE